MSSLTDQNHSNVNVSSHLTRMAITRPYQRAVVYPAGRDHNGRVAYAHLTFRQLDRESDRLAHGLGKAGLTRGTRTILMVKPSLEFFALVFAMFKCGAVPVVVDPGMGIRRMLVCLQESDPEAFIGISLALTFPIVITVIYLGNPDLGTILCAYMGSFLLAGAFLSIGIMTSSLTRSQVISFIMAVVGCLFFVLAGYPPVTEVFSGWAPVWLLNMVYELGFLPHFNSITRGVLDFRDLIYYLSVIIFMLFVNGVVLQNRRTT